MKEEIFQIWLYLIMVEESKRKLSNSNNAQSKKSKIDSNSHTQTTEIRNLEANNENSLNGDNNETTITQSDAVEVDFNQLNENYFLEECNTEKMRS